MARKESEEMRHKYGVLCGAVSNLSTLISITRMRCKRNRKRFDNSSKLYDPQGWLSDGTFNEAFALFGNGCGIPGTVGGAFRVLKILSEAGCYINAIIK